MAPLPEKLGQSSGKLQSLWEKNVLDTVRVERGAIHGMGSHGNHCAFGVVGSGSSGSCSSVLDGTTEELGGTLDLSGRRGGDGSCNKLGDGRDVDGGSVL